MSLSRRVIVFSSLAATTIFSSTILPLVIPPFGGYPARQVVEVLIWQGIAAIGWPFALFGASVSILFGTAPPSPSLLIMLLYPAFLAVTAKVLISKSSQAWELALLHTILVASFVAVLYSIRNGYDFMVG